MRAVKTHPRYRCDYCRKVLTLAAMERHERICWRNPDRYCPHCENRGEFTEDYGDGLYQTVPCWFCSQFDPQIGPSDEP